MDGGDILDALNDTQFGQKMRGYDPLEVDELLDGAAEEITALREAARKATERATVAEAQLQAELGPAREARGQAEETLAAATAEAARILDAAQADADSLRQAGEQELRRAIDEGRGRLLAEISSLEADRQAVDDDIAILERHVDAHRARLSAALTDLQSLVNGLPRRPERPVPPMPAAVETAPPPEPAPEPAASAPAPVDETQAVPPTSPAPADEMQAVPPTPSTPEPTDETQAPQAAAPTPASDPLLGELRDSVGVEGVAMDTFFAEDDAPSSMFRRR